MFKALKELQSYYLEKNDGETVNNVSALVLTEELNDVAEKARRKTF